jgi:hypothetical protein
MAELIRRAKEGRLSRDELDAVAARLERGDVQEEEVHELLSAMEIAGDRRYRRAVDRLLDFQQSPGIVSRALELLCFDWRLVDDYFDWLYAFVEGVDWDQRWTVREVRSQAFMLAGWYLRSKQSRSLLQLLIRIAVDPTELPDQRGEASAALFSVFVPPHLSPNELPPTDPRFPETLRRARERLATEPEGPPREGRVPRPRQVELPPHVAQWLPRDLLGTDLVQRARRGQLSRPELDAVAGQLAEPLAPHVAQERLLTLFFSGDARYRAAVEPHLAAADPATAGVALAILTVGWKLTRDYQDRLVSLVWHGQPELRRLALLIVGTYLTTRRSRDLLQLLVRLAEDASRPDVQAQAAIALHHTFGIPPTLPTEETITETDVTYILGPARERLETE